MVSVIAYLYIYKNELPLGVFSQVNSRTTRCRKLNDRAKGPLRSEVFLSPLIFRVKAAAFAQGCKMSGRLRESELFTIVPPKKAGNSNIKGSFQKREEGDKKESKFSAGNRTGHP